jgi:hypothetical protein
VNPDDIEQIKNEDYYDLDNVPVMQESAENPGQWEPKPTPVEFSWNAYPYNADKSVIHRIGFGTGTRTNLYAELIPQDNGVVTVKMMTTGVGTREELYALVNSVLLVVEEDLRQEQLSQEAEQDTSGE